MYREHVAYTGVGVAHVPCASEDTPLPQTGGGPLQRAGLPEPRTDFALAVLCPKG